MKTGKFQAEMLIPEEALALYPETYMDSPVDEDGYKFTPMNHDLIGLGDKYCAKPEPSPNDVRPSYFLQRCWYRNGSNYSMLVSELLGPLGIRFRSLGTLPILIVVYCLEPVLYSFTWPRVRTRLVQHQ